MRYHYEKPDHYTTNYGEVYTCDHPVYSSCTLFKNNEFGLAVIQQRYDPISKTTWWGELDEWLPDELYSHPDFKMIFEDRSGKIDKKGFYPTITIRQLMWSLKMKPLPKSKWETAFDRRKI